MILSERDATAEDEKGTKDVSDWNLEMRSLCASEPDWKCRINYRHNSYQTKLRQRGFSLTAEDKRHRTE